MHKNLIHWIRFTFGFSRTEANAYLVLITLLIGAHFVTTHFARPGNRMPPESLDSLVSAMYSITEDTIIPMATLNFFDPNSISYDSLTAMGLPGFLVSNLIKYRKAGGYFSKPEDLQKLYGMTDSIWLNLNPWVKIERAKFSKIKKSTTSHSPKNGTNLAESTRLMDLNKADTSWLLGIYGIGTVLSSRIIKYRTLLGGFHSLNQLREVYNLPEETIGILQERVFIDSLASPVVKLHLNQVSSRQLAQHPYISFNLARAIVAYRDQHGPFQNGDDLKRIHLMDDSIYFKVSPYLDF